MKMLRRTQPSGKNLSAGDGFTLVELLVVMAVIAIVAAIILPVLHKAHESAQNITCLNNERQLQICWHLYTVDNNDWLVPNNSVAFISQGTGPPTSDIQGVSWLPDVDASTEVNPSNIINGLLFPYNSQLGIYHCPSDMSMLETPDGQQLSQFRWRSYNMSQSVNGYPTWNWELSDFIPMWDQLMQIRQPTLSATFVFIDEDSDSIADAEFGNPPENSPYFEQDVWWDLPSSRHNRGGNLSFADGHVEHWRWAVPKVFYEYVQPVSAGEMPDYERIQNAMNQQLPVVPPGY
jgi:prepilin-type N-terminal cleavage/methylation domain-containing protein/prepilin-type processing-associated H-X9-DG protein